MSAMGTALAYLFTCMTAYKYVANFPDIPEARWGKPVAIIGGLTSISCFAMLALPGSPAAIGIESCSCFLSGSPSARPSTSTARPS